MATVIRCLLYVDGKPCPGAATYRLTLSDGYAYDLCPACTASARGKTMTNMGRQVTIVKVEQVL